MADLLSWGWLAWTIVGLAMEATALANRERGDTLSENIWKLTTTRRWARALLVMGLAWAFVHLVFRIV